MNRQEKKRLLDVLIRGGATNEEIHNTTGHAPWTIKRRRFQMTGIRAREGRAASSQSPDIKKALKNPDVDKYLIAIETDASLPDATDADKIRGDVVRRRLHPASDELPTQEEIARNHRVTSERVNQIERGMVKKILGIVAPDRRTRTDRM